MRIDFHRHLYSATERYESVRKSVRRSGIGGAGESAGIPVEVPLVERAAEIRREMESAGVAKSCLLLGDYGLLLGEGARSIEEENERALRLAADDPEHFIAFFGMDPRRPQAADQFRKALDAGAKGLKLHPCTGFFPNDPACYPLYELASERGVPVAVHTGPMAAPLLSEYANPVYLDAPAAAFPDLNFVMLHAGQRAWFEPALDMARWKPNFLLEISHWQSLYLEDERNFILRLIAIKSSIGLDRVIFGSDLPGLSGVMGLRTWVEAFERLPEAAARYDLKLTDEDVARMLGGAAASVLGITA